MEDDNGKEKDRKGELVLEEDRVGEVEEEKKNGRKETKSEREKV